MSDEERIEKYIKSMCINCKNKDKQECEIRVFQNEDIICTSCINYKSINPIRRSRVNEV